MSIAFGGKLLYGKSSSTGIKLSGSAEEFLQTWSDESQLAEKTAPRKRRLSSYVPPTGSRASPLSLNQTAPPKLDPSKYPLAPAMFYTALPVFTLPPLEPPPLNPDKIRPKYGFDLENVERCFAELTPSDSLFVRRYLGLRESAWEEIRVFLSRNKTAKGSSFRDSRRNVFQTAMEVIHSAANSNKNIASTIIIQADETLLRESTTVNTSTSRSHDRNQRFKGTRRRKRPPRTPTAQQQLQLDLLQSLQSLQSHSNHLKAGLLQLPKIVEIKENKAVVYLQSLGAQKVIKFLRHILKRQLTLGWKAWKLAVDVELKNSNVRRVHKFIKYRILSLTWNKTVTKSLRRVMRIWLSVVYFDTLIARKRLEHASASSIQRVFRVYFARLRINRNREKMKLERIYAALVGIQAFFRGRKARFQYIRMIRVKLENESLRCLQRVARGYLGRKKAFSLRILKRQRDGVKRIQSLFRGWRIRKNILRIKRDQRERNASILIQALVRGHLSRLHIRSIRLMNKQLTASLQIQRVVRGYLCRLRLPLLLAEIAAYRKRRNAASILIQKTYRGFRGRVIIRIMRREYTRLRKIQDPAATRINAVVRGYLAKKCRKRLEREMQRNRLYNAKNIKECWSDAHNCWYYYNETTGESTWEPPSTGYTKYDSQLVLDNGQIVDDPSIFTAEEEREGLVQTVDSKFCSECSKRIAIRYCTQCGDKFCCPCYKEQHSSGSRLKHVWEPLGPKECSDCEVELAERFCIPCDEAFFDGCWQRVHLKGKRRFHPFSPIDMNGNVDSRLFTIDGTELSSSYDPLYVQQQIENTESALVPAVTNDSVAVIDDWIYAYDDNGYIYWYNNRTGQSQYEDPYSTQQRDMSQ